MASAQFRCLSPEEHDAFQRVLDYAFSAEDGPQQSEKSSPTDDGLGRRFGVVADGTVRSACKHYEFTVSLRDEWVPLAGLATLATRPEYRRQGDGRRLVEGSLREWRGEFPLAALWPFDYGYYEQFGWAMATKLATYTCPPEALAFGRDAPGTLRRVGPDDWADLRAVDEAYSDDRDLVVRRDEQWWRQRIFRTIGGEDRYVYALDRDGQTQGYVAYTVGSDDDTSRLVSYYSGFTDRDAYRGLLGYLSNHDSQVDEVRLYRNAGSSLLDAVPDPGAVDCEIHSGAMLRIVDVVDALEVVSYPDDCTETVTLDVSDDTAEWNDEQFELSVSGGRGGCSRVSDSHADAEADSDVALDIGTLTKLLVGFHSVAEARRFGDLRVESDAVADRLSALFPPRTVCPLDNF